MNLLATNYFIATEAELPEIYAVYLEQLAELDGVTDAAQAHKLLTEFAPTDDRYPSVLSSKVLVELP